MTVWCYSCSAGGGNIGMTGIGGCLGNNRRCFNADGG